MADATITRMRPLWRWWLWCAALWLSWRCREGSLPQRLCFHIVAWAPLPAWFGIDDVHAWNRGEDGTRG